MAAGSELQSLKSSVGSAEMLAELPDVHLLRAAFSPQVLIKQWSFLPRIRSFPMGSWKAPLSSPGAMVRRSWQPLLLYLSSHREREEYFACSASGRGSAQQKRSAKVLLSVWFGLKFRWKGVVTYWSGRVLSRCCSLMSGWTRLGKEGSETCVPSWTLSKVLPQKK